MDINSVAAKLILLRELFPKGGWWWAGAYGGRGLLRALLEQQGVGACCPRRELFP